MTDYGKRNTCRILFFSLCVAPTIFNVTTSLKTTFSAASLDTISGGGILETHSQKGETNRLNRTEQDPKQESDDQQPRQDPMLVSLLKAWGISKKKTEIEHEFRIHLDKFSLPTDHPLTKYISGAFQIRQTEQSYTFTFEQVQLGLEDLNRGWENLRQAIHLSLEDSPPCQVVIKQLLLRIPVTAGQSSGSLVFSNVQFSSKNGPEPVTIEGEIQEGIGQDRLAHPIQLTVSTNQNQLTTTLIGNFLPIQLFGLGLVQWTGENAIFRGQVHLSSSLAMFDNSHDASHPNDNSMSFNGEFTEVTCQSLFVEEKEKGFHPPMTGICKFQSVENRFENGNLKYLKGTITSMGQGIVRQSITEKFPGQVNWIPQFNSIEYQSFSAQVDYRDGRLLVAANDEFQGQLIWGVQLPILIITSWTDFWAASYQPLSFQKTVSADSQPYNYSIFQRELEWPKQRPPSAQEQRIREWQALLQ